MTAQEELEALREAEAGANAENGHLRRLLILALGELRSYRSSPEVMREIEAYLKQTERQGCALTLVL